MEATKSIFHINEVKKWNTVLNNINNYIFYDDRAEIKLLVNGQAVEELLKEGIEEERIESLINRGIEIFVCENSLRAYKINHDDLIDEIKLTPVGVVFLAEAQKKGYAYIKP